MPKDKDKKLLAKVKEPKASKDPMAAVYMHLMANVDKKFDLSTGDFSPLRISTGMLAIDYVCAGGLVPGMTTIAGFEGSGKSTMEMEALGCGLAADIPILRVDDAEGTFDGLYTSNVLQQPLAPLLPQFRKGKLINNPRIWYSLNNEIEIYYDSLFQTLNRIPDKRFSKEKKTWFYVIDKKNKHHMDFAAALKNVQSDAVMSRGNKLFFPASNTAPQGIFFLDSYPTLVTHRQMEKEVADGMPTAAAIAFSKNIPRVVGFLKRKSVIVFGINQMRERPGMAFGSPQYETGANALKLWSNCRLLVTARTVQKEWKASDSTDSKFHIEPSVEYKGKHDHYAYKHIRNLKLKHGTPYLECWQRIWIKDGRKPGQGRGFDKVHDTFEYLLLNDFISVEKGRIKSFTFNTLGDKKNAHPLSGKTISWMHFKVLILNEYLKDKTEYLQDMHKETLKALKLKEPPKLREFCAHHLKSISAK